LNPIVIKLGIVSFFADVASEMLYPVTPIFLTATLGASMTSIGVIEGIAEAIASLLKTYSGAWSDRLAKRKPFIVAGYFLGAISKPWIGLSHRWTEVLLARAMDRTGKGLRSAPRDALIADSVTLANRGAAFGWHRAMDTFGAAVGPLIAVGFLAYHPDSLRSLYYWALLPGLISVFIVLTIREKRHHAAPGPTWTNPFRAWAEMPTPFKKYVCAWGAFSLTNSSDVFLILQAKASGLSSTWVILLYCAYNLVYSLSSPYLGRLSDSIERKHVLIFGLLVFVAVYVGFGFASAPWHFCVLFFTYGFYMAATDGVGKALAVDLTPAHLKATGIGMLGTVTGFATIVASISAGLIWDHFGARWTFLFGAFGALVASLMLLRIRSNLVVADR